MNLKNSILILSVLSVLAGLESCNRRSEKSKKEIQDSIKTEALKKWDETIPGSFSDQTDIKFDSAALGKFFKSYPEMAVYKDSISEFYKRRNYAYAWFDKKGIIEQAGNLADRIRNIDTEGISSKSVPYTKDLDSLIYADQGRKTPSTETELMLTGQYFVFANKVWQGVDEKASKSVQWYVPRKKVSYSDLLDSLLTNKSSVYTVEGRPVYRQYMLLKSFLTKYRELESQREVITIGLDAGKKSYKIGDSSDNIVKIRKRLHFLGDYKESDTLSALYDANLKEAVSNFQERHGLTNDGVIGAGTIKEMNVPLRDRVKTIIVNMERFRWVPAGLNKEYLGVNIPEYKLHVYNADSLLWSCNVVVGKELHKTVVFQGDLKYIVFSPYWNVPPSIVRNEILPAMNRNAGYLKQHNMEITGHENGLPVIRQLPGRDNSLGLVKFLFPNNFNIYLHDTPAKSLFSMEDRAFSHGCIRVSEPKKLAEFLLKDDKAWDSISIDKAMHQTKEKWVTLKNPVPVFISYFTAFVDRKGQINFRKDIYDRDSALEKMILN